MSVTVTVNPAVTRAISPYIYGLNAASSVSGAPAGITLDRTGGNRWTAYNWETNASNAGSDYNYENDNYLSASTVPAQAITSIIQADQSNGWASIMTVPMQGLVAGDESGPVSVANPPDLSRFKQLVYQKNTESSAAFTATPPTSDAYVYMDEFVWAVNAKFAGDGIFGSSPTKQPVFVQLDNEPELWNSTHLEIQGPNAIPVATYLSKTLALSEAIKTQFPNVQILGPVDYGFEGIYDFQGDPSISATPSGNNWFADVYLAAVHSAAASFGRPVVDVYDFHWYSEATDGSGNRVGSLNSATLSAAQVQAIVQSPRSLWDPTFTENSWITADVLNAPIQILPRLNAKIAALNPGMKLSITEYNNGGALHIAGTIAEADNLGIFGAQGLFAASLWLLQSNEPYILGGFAAFRDFDGANSNFGDTSVQTTSSNVANVAVYTSTDSTRPGRVVFVAINRSTSSQVTQITGQPLSGTAHLFQMTASTASAQANIVPVAVGTQAVAGASLTITLPALSVTTIDCY